MQELRRWDIFAMLISARAYISLPLPLTRCAGLMTLLPQFGRWREYICALLSLLLFTFFCGDADIFVRRVIITRSPHSQALVTASRDTSARLYGLGISTHLRSDGDAIGSFESRTERARRAGTMHDFTTTATVIISRCLCRQLGFPRRQMRYRAIATIDDIFQASLAAAPGAAARRDIVRLIALIIKVNDLACHTGGFDNFQNDILYSR